MKVLIDINHPAHVHFFRVPAQLLIRKGHAVVFTSRDKDVTQALLDELGLEHRCLSSMGSGMWHLARELIFRNAALWRLVRKEQPDVMLAIGGTFIAHVGAVSSVPSLVFYDTENARLQNLITYPLARLVIAPRCYEAWLPKRHRRYTGYHELSYLHPDHFTPDRDVALANGLATAGPSYMVRVVSWQANHDVGETGWSIDLLSSVVDHLSQTGTVIIVSEQSLPAAFDRYLYRGAVAKIHHLMSGLRLFVGESATMASECAVLGVPAIYAAQTGRGYTNEQEQRYGLVRNLATLTASAVTTAIDDMLAVDEAHYQERRQRMLDECEDVAQVVVDLAEEFGARS